MRPLTESSCRENEEFLYAVDLFNAGFWWEAHVAWERLWHLARPESSERRFLAGLIQLAASCLKHEMGNPKGAEKLYARSQKHHRHLEPRRQFGVDLDALASAARAYFASETPELTLHLDV